MKLVALMISVIAEKSQHELQRDRAYCDDLTQKEFDGSKEYVGGGAKFKKKWKYNNCLFRAANGQNSEDLIIYRRFFQSEKYIGNGYFVEMGALNGITFSNSLMFEYCLGWKGLLIEAHPVNYGNLVDQRPCATNYWTAICPANDQNMMYISREGSVGTVSPTKPKNGVSYMTPCRTMQSIFDEQNITWVDFFSLDVEGAELIVLETIDFSKTEVGVFLVETAFDKYGLIDAFFAKTTMLRLNSTALPGSVSECVLQKKHLRLRQTLLQHSTIYVHPTLREEC
jgi:FkbM family methyltransferase